MNDTIIDALDFLKQIRGIFKTNEEVFGCPVGHRTEWEHIKFRFERTLKPAHIDVNAVLVCLKGILEEYDELCVALDNYDNKEVDDACCDIIVFAAGALHHMGSDAETVFRAYKGSFVGLEPAVHAVGRTIDNFNLVTGGGVRRTMIDESGFVTIECLIAEVIQNVIGEFYDDNLFTLNRHLEAVRVSNYTKAVWDHAEAVATVQKYSDIGVGVATRSIIEGQEYPMIAYANGDQIDNSGKAYPDGKCVKSVNFKAPVFE